MAKTEQIPAGIAVTVSHADLLFHLGKDDSKTVVIPLTDEQRKIVSDLFEGGYTICHFSAQYDLTNTHQPK